MTATSPRPSPNAGDVGGPFAQSSLRPGIQISSVTYWLAGALLLVTDIAAGLTLFGGLLSGPVVMMGSARGTALVLLFVTTPVLAATMFYAASGSALAVVIWLGALAAVLYNAGLLLCETPFNALFLMYVAMLGLSVWAIAMLLHDNSIGQVAARVDARMPVRLIAAYLWVIAGVNALVWLRAIVPAVLSAEPMTVLAGTGLTTNTVWIQDLALFLPLAIAAGVWLWQRRPAGFLIGGAVLTMWIFESISVAVDQWFGHQADPTSTVVSLSMVPAFAFLALLGVLPLSLHLRHVRSERRPRIVRRGMPMIGRT